MQKFDTPAPITAVLDIPAGRLQFIAADRTDTTVEVRPANATKSRDVQGGGADHGQLHRRRPADRHPNEEPVSSAPPDPSRSPSSCPPAPASRPRPPAPNSAASAASATSPSRARTARSRSTRPRASASPRSTATSSRPPERPRGDQHRKGRHPLTEAARGTVVLRTQSGDISVGAAAGVSAALDAGTCLRPDQQRPQEQTAPPPPRHPRHHLPRRHRRPQPLTRSLLKEHPS